MTILGKLGLFGAEIDVHATGPTSVTHLGDFPVEGEIKRSAADKLEIKLKGKVCGVALDLSFRSAYRVTGGRIELVAPPSADSSVTAILLLDREISIGAPRLKVAADWRTGLLVEARNGEAFAWLNQDNRLPPLISLDLAVPGAEIALDVAAATATHRSILADGLPILVADQFLYSTAPPLPLGPTQTLRASAIVFDEDGYELVAAPDTGTLFLHADILSTSQPDPDANAFLFQYAVANGALSASGPLDARPANLHWVGTDGRSPAVLLFRNQDEHGQPLAFVTDGAIPLAMRAGFAHLVTDSAQPEAWNWTNPALVIGSPVPERPLELQGQLMRLDDEALYANFVAPAGAKNSLERPWFIVDGACPLAPTPPTSIHGLSRGTWLRALNASASAGPAVPQPLSARLLIDALLDGGEAVFHSTRVELPEAQEWELVALREERDLGPERGGAAAVGAYRAKGLSGPLELPAIDLGYALSNLAGVDRVSSSGDRFSDGKLQAFGRHLLERLEGQLSGPSPTRFEVPTIPVQRHADGAGVVPLSGQAFARLLDMLPTSAAAEETGRPGPELKGFRNASLNHALTAEEGSQLVFGGADGDVIPLVDALRDRGDLARQALGPVLSHLQKAWRNLIADPDVRAIRAQLGVIDRQPISPERASELLAVAIEYVQARRNLDDITDDADSLLEYLWNVTPEEFARDWLDPQPPDGFSQLLEHLWSPGDYDLLRRVVRLLAGGGAPPPPPLLEKLLGIRDASELLTVLEYIDTPAGGVLQGAIQGVNELWEKVAHEWRSAGDAAVAALRAKYGPLLTPDVYRKLLEDAAREDAEAFLDHVNSALGVDLRSLADLSAEPPEYVFRTRRFPLHAPMETTTEALWRQSFDLCGFATGKAWSFFLDDGASVILKLSRKRTLPDILREIARTYAAGNRPDPLGLADVLPPDAAQGDPREAVEAYIRTLDPDLAAAEWVGIFFVRPVADIHEDAMLRDLCGFDHITASYVAVGGRKPSWGTASIDVWAHIFKQKNAGEDLPGDPRKEGHVKLALTKFDVRVRQTKLSDASIEIKIFPKDVWGKQKDFKEIILYGGLEPAGKDPDAPRDLVFAAYFPQPFRLDIDLAFVNRLELSMLRVARRNGATSIDIDGKLLLQELDGLDLQLKLKDAALSLQNFRIQLPALKGMRVEIGALRKLDFDFPAVSITLPNPRAVNLFGVEVVPTGLGYIRGSETAALADFRNQYIWLRRLSDIPERSYVSYLSAELHFGKFPGFGLVEARGLRFRCVIAVRTDGGITPKQAYFGIGGLDAKDLKLDLFGFITLEMERLRISPAVLRNGSQTSRAGAVLAERVRLKILGWSPTPKNSRLDLMMLHPMDSGPGRDTRKGLLAFYDAEAKVDKDEGEEEPKESFFQLFWLLLAHNMKLPKTVLDQLLERGPNPDEPPEGLLKQLLEKPKEGKQPTDPRHDLVLSGVELLDRESWLFGLSFKLGTLFERCNLVLHDQHYYGIHLWAPWVKAVFGQESIELAYIPGKTRQQDRFRTNLRVPALDMLGYLRSGEIALEWSPNWDFLIDIGFPWRTSIGYDWFRAFSVPVGAYEGKFGFYIEKRTVALAKEDEITLGAGAALYVGYFFGAGNSVAWVRAGIGVFGILQGSMTLTKPKGVSVSAFLKSTIRRIEVTGVVGVFAYGEGGVEVWILSARFRVSAQASVATSIVYVVGGPCTLTYTTHMGAHYSASVRVGSGPFKWTFRVSGQVGMPVSGRLLLN